MQKVVVLLLAAILIFSALLFTKYSFDGITGNVQQMQQSPILLELTSPSFSEKGFIPEKYTCNGEKTSPPLIIQNVPENTVSLVLIMYDLNTRPEKWVHWVLFNIPAETRYIAEDSFPASSLNAKNSWGINSYGGPCPPFGTHNYIFTLYALDTKLNLDQTATKKEIEAAMQEHILEETSLTGLYSHKE